MTSDGPKRVALYTRVSTEDQVKEGFSLDAQIERLHKYAEAQGWDVVGVFVEEGHSGRTTKRPAYQAMLNAKDDWDSILVLKMDRIHRNSRNFMAMMDFLAEENKGFVSATESLDTSTAMGRFVMDIIQRIAQLESEQIGERVYIGMEQKAKAGKCWLTKRPFGYTISKEKNLKVAKKEADAVRWIHDTFHAGESMRAIANLMNAKGWKTTSGNPWKGTNVGKVLESATYLGVRDWDGQIQENNHSPIISQETFDRTARNFAEKRGQGWKGQQYNFLTRQTADLMEGDSS